MARKNYEQEAISAGFADVDGLAGYLAGRRGDLMIAPEHFVQKRVNRWSEGYLAGLGVSKSEIAGRFIVVSFYDKDGQPQSKILRGWSVARGKYLTQLQAQGVGSAVDFTYFQGGDQKRVHHCAI